MANLERILARVEKPIRYVGGELNAIVKDWHRTPVRMVLAFPDVYEVGMSALETHILYHVVNSRDDALMERVFTPWIDMETEMRREGLPLFSLESHRPLRDFEVIVFILQYELSYTNVLNMLELAGIPLESRERNGRMPLVVASGPCAFNPEPLASFLDAVLLGDGEETLPDLVEAVRRYRHRDREQLLRALARVPGVYVPRFYRIEYAADGGVERIVPQIDGVPGKVVKRAVRDLDRAPYPVRPIVPYLEVVHDRAVLEISRGCTRGCRFCQAGTIHRPVREKNLETLLDQAGELLRNTGYNELSLTSPSVTDHTDIRRLVVTLGERCKNERVSLLLPSFRVEPFAVELAQTMQETRKRSLTFAPEAGSERLREVINKQVTERDLLETVEAALLAGWFRIKLCFMLGLPTETLDDIDGIVQLVRMVQEKGRECGVPKGRLRVAVNTAIFVPKPHTPFQWEPQAPLAVLHERQAFLQGRLKAKNLAYSWQDPEASFLEAVFARGDRRLGAVLRRALELGCRLDGQPEYFRFDRWQQAFSETGIDPGAYAYRSYGYTDVLPWDHLDAGIDKDFLSGEHARALAGESTGDCRNQPCNGCGVCPNLGVEPRLAEVGNRVAG